MNKNYNLKLDLQFRCNNSIMKFNQFDNNTSDFFMRITNGGNLVDIEKAIVVLAVIKPSGKVSSQFIEVKNGLIYADLKPNMRDEIGTYTAKAMLILEDERVVTDVISYEVEEDKIFSLLNDTVGTSEEFTLLTDMLSRLSTIEISEEQRVINEAERILSEENRKIEEAKRVEAELIRQHEEADRTKYDATRESNENIRKQNESIRLANETNRIDKEAKRVEEEANRVEAEQLRKDNYNFMTEDEERRRVEANAHKEAEKLRTQAENTRVSEEAKRRTTEQARVSAENTRVSNENTRKANEITRQTNETQRVEAETQRQNRYNSFILEAEANANNFENYTNTAKVKEEERKSNELDRKSQEDRRVSNEVERISNENTRKANEAVREKNETSRQYVFENKVNEVDKKIVELNTTKDNFVSNINTKVDTKISEIDNVKDNFVSSVNTKVDSKISELDNAKSDMTNTVSNKVNEVETRFNALTSSQQQSSEVIDARDGETSLKTRLDRDIEKTKQVYANVEGSNISTDSSVGYLRDIEILGNTIQNASNLADIRSVGDKVEGQELYEIPVLSCGKNLINKVVNGNVSSAGDIVDNMGAKRARTDYIQVDCNKQYRIKNYGENNSISYVIRFAFDKDKKLLNNGGWNTNYYNNIQVYPQGTKYVIYEFANEMPSVSDIDINSIKVQLEEGTQATPYEPYQEDKLTILSPTPLEKVGDVRDRLICKDGVWGVEKNVNNVVLNGSESWGHADSYIDNTNYIRFRLDDIPTNVKSNSDCICNKLKAYSGGTSLYSVKDNCVAWYSDNQFQIKIEDSIIGINNTVTVTGDKINALKTWLKSNNLLVKYQLTQPTFIPLPHDQQIKLRTFASKTNISFGCEIEGTIKAQVPKSIGATVNTHTEQIRSLNNELNRVKKLEESTVSTVTTESDFTTVEATSNGYFEDVKLEGKTLVNICKGEIIESGLDMQITVYKQSQIATIINNSNKKIYFDTNNIDGTYKKSLTIAPNSIFLYEQDNDLIKLLNAHNTFGWTFSEKEYFKNNCFILEGDHTQNPPAYFEGLKSVGQDVDEVSVASVNENLFNGEFVIGSITDATGVDNNSATAYRSKNYIKVDSNETYYYGFDINQTFTSPNIYCYDENKNFISKISGVSNLNKFTTPTNCKYVRVRIFDISNFKDVFVTNAFISKKDRYTPHQSDKKHLLYYNEETQTWEKPILRQWDSIEKHANGKYYYHVRSKEGDYVEGDESLNDCITDLTVSVKKLAEEKVYECTNIDLITYANETNYIIESGVLSPRTTLKVHNNISNVVSLLQKKVSLLESNVTSYMITQNRLMLASRYNADTVSFKVDVASFSDTFEYDNDLYELILNNILVGKDNYNREYIENLTRFYWMDFVISDEMYSTLFEIIEEQHNPKIEEETPLI